MTALPLDGIRVLDVTDGLGESCSRFLADLGADVVRVEAPGGSRSRTVAPMRDGISIPFALRNANKRGVVLDLTADDGRAGFHDLLGTADILVESMAPGWLAAQGLAPESLLAEQPSLIVVSVSGFGQTGPYRDWTATESVISAMSGVLSRSGESGEEPLLPPAGLVDESVGVHAAWSALLALYNRTQTGAGQLVDISAFETIVHGFDPGFGVQGSAAAGRKEDFPRGRPDAANFYPVFPCADGQVRICLLAKRQWRAMFEWLGEPAEFADPKYDTIPARFAAADRLHPLIDRLFANYTRSELVAEGAARGIPTGGVQRPDEVLTTEHFDVAGTLIDAEIAPGVTARVPSGYAKIGGERAGFRYRAPQLGEHDADILDGDAASRQVTSSDTDGRSAGSAPFEGLRVLDMGVVVFGAELGRQFADNGADVIKIENTAFPDGLRQSKRGSALAASVAWGHRNKRSLGLNLRTDDGKRLFLELAKTADVVLANFKPGTLKSMGLSYDDLVQVNPAIIVAESSAFGGVGPWNKRLGYGPLVRAACGVSALWRYSNTYEGLCDGATVYPDHIAAQVNAVAILAHLVARRHTARGAALEVAQADTAIVQLGVELAEESLNPGSVVATGNSDAHAAPSGVYASAGDDEWCAVTVRDDDEWARLCAIIERPDLVDDPRFVTTEQRLAHRADADALVGEWVAERTPTEAMETLQEGGVPAGAMIRLPDLLTNPQLVQRKAYRQLSHPLLPMAMPTAVRVAHFSSIPDAPLRPAPLPGENTREIAAEILGLSDTEIDTLVDADVLQPGAVAPVPS